MANSEEILPIVDENGGVTGKMPRSRCHSGEKHLHPVVHLHVFDRSGRLLLQHRALTKKIQPGKWDTAVGGHVSYGESIEVALLRETAEEIGLKEFKPVKICGYVFESQIEREYVNTFYTVVDESFRPEREESDIDDLRFFTVSELEQMIERGEVTPNFAGEYRTYVKTIADGLQ